MQRASGHAISGWAAILAAPFLVPIALLLGFLPLKKTTDRTAGEVADFLRNFIEGRGGDWDWDEFETVPITDPALNLIRQEAVMAGPGYTRESADIGKLTELLRRVEALP